MTKIGDLPSTLATYVYLLDCSGTRAADDAVGATCDEIRAAIDADSDVEALGTRLAEQLEAELEGDDPGKLLARLYGESALGSDFGSDRVSRLQEVRRRQFDHLTPWLASLVERSADGVVSAHWILVEKFDDDVTCMDPFPFDRLEEERLMPLWEFVVKWELAGCAAWRVD